MMGFQAEKIAPHIPVFDKSNRTDGTFSRADFEWDGEIDRYIYPAGKDLRQFHRTHVIPRSGITSERIRLYRARKKDCDACELKQRYCPNAVARKVPRDLNEDARDVARAIAGTPDYERSRHRRKKVEMVFSHLKRILRMARLRLRLGASQPHQGESLDANSLKNRLQSVEEAQTPSFSTKAAESGPVRFTRHDTPSPSGTLMILLYIPSKCLQNDHIVERHRMG